MKEICIDARMLLSGGIGTYLRNLIPRFKSAPFNVKLIVTPDAVEAYPWLRSFELIFCSAPIYSIQEQLKLPFIVPSVDLFWSPHYNIPLSPIRAKKRLVTIHDAHHLAFLSSFRAAERLYAKVVIGNAVKRSEKVITVSDFSQAELLKYTKVKKENVSVIPLGVDAELFSPHQNKDLVTKVKELYKLPDKFILFVGNVKPHKNLQGLIKAMKHVWQKGFEEYKLVIVGKKEGFIHGDDVELQVKAGPLLNDRVMFIGKVLEEHLPVFYQLASVAILPSFYEGFGLPALEAMSCGCPMIVSNVASLPEFCKDAVEYVQPEDSQNIALGLIRVLSNDTLKENLKQKGLIRSQEYCWEDTANKHIQIIEELCNM